MSFNDEPVSVNLVRLSSSTSAATSLAGIGPTVLLRAGMAILGHSTSGILRHRATGLWRDVCRAVISTRGVEHNSGLDRQGR